MNTLTLSREGTEVLMKSVQERYSKVLRKWKKVHDEAVKENGGREPIPYPRAMREVLDELCEYEILMDSIGHIAYGYGIVVDWKK